jgi:hypothetical protein
MSHRRSSAGKRRSFKLALKDLRSIHETTSLES